MRYAPLSIIALASVAGCAMPTSPSSTETITQDEQASTAAGITASIAITGQDSFTYSGTVTIKNGGKSPASNWQVAVNMNQSTLVADNSGEAYVRGSTVVFAPSVGGTPLAAGASTVVYFRANKTGSSFTPTVISVDGVANGAAGTSTDGVDHIARAAATAALSTALAYESFKRPNNGDPNYGRYDTLIWSSHSYILSSDGKQIQFDPNVMGYAYIPDQAKAELAFAQLDPSVASYLSAGLQSCFADTSGAYVYALRADALKNYTFSTSTKTLSIAAGGTNPTTGTNKVSVVGTASGGAEQITATETQSSGVDWSFGLLTTNSVWSFTNTSPIIAKYHSGNGIPCSPFNGPGGGAGNPYLVISINGSHIYPRQQVTAVQCQNMNCSSSIVIDPVAYATAGAYYNAAGLVGPQPNPFTLDPTVLYAVSDHKSQFSLNPYSHYGTFSTAVTMFGTTKYKFNVCGNTGSGC